MCQFDYILLLISYLRTISIYKLLVVALFLMCLACCVAFRVGFTFGYCRNGTFMLR